MDLGFAGKIVAVTGASKGIGFACAEAFAREGAKVALVSRSAANLDAALVASRRCALSFRSCASRRSHPRRGQRRGWSTKSSARWVPSTFSSTRPVPRAATRRRDLDAAAWHAAMDAKYLQLHPPDRRGVAAHGGPRSRNHRQHHRLGRQGRESRASAGRRRQCRADAGDRRPRGRALRRRASASTASTPDRRSPGACRKALVGGGEDDGPSPRKSCSKRMQAKIPLGRLGTPEEVAQVALFLASTHASYVTGAIHAHGRRSQPGVI